MTESAYLSKKAIADIFGVSQRTIDRWRKEKPEFPEPSPLSGWLKWKKSEIEQLVQSEKQTVCME